MVGIFSTNRSDALGLERARSYLKYAVGEVILIVVGILIAIQLDGMQRDRAERALETRYLQALMEDIRFDIENSEGWFNRFEGKVAGLKAAKEYFHTGVDMEDPDALLTTIGKGGSGSRGRLVGDSPTFRDLISTGSLRYVQSQELKASIMDFYGYKDFVGIYANNLRTNYAGFTNSIRPYDPAGNLEKDPRDIEVALRKFKEPEFLSLVNQELTYAYSINNVMSIHRQNAQDLVSEIAAYLGMQ